MPQSIVSNTIVATTGRVVNVAAGLLAVKLLTHWLGPGGYGSYALLLSFGTILQLVADGGLYLQLTRSIAAAPHRQRELMTTIFSLRLLLLSLVFSVGLGVIITLPAWRVLAWPFAIVALGLALQSLSQLYMGIFQYQQAVWRATIGDIAGRLGQIASIVFFGGTAAALAGMATAFTIGSGIALLVHQAMLPARLVRLDVNWLAWKQVLRSSWPLGALLLLNAIYFRIDTVILSYFRPPVEVGWYSLAYRIIESALFFPAMFGGLLLPRLSEAVANQQPQKLRQYLSEGLSIQLLIVGFVMITLVMRAKEIILFIADVSFMPAAPVVSVLSLALAIMFFGNVFGFTMIALQKQTSLLKLYIVLAFANTIGNILAIPRGGMMAAAVTTISTEAVATLVVAWIIWRIVPYRLTPRSIVGTAVAVCLGVIVYRTVPPAWPLLIHIGLAGLGYAVGILAAGSVTSTQLSLLRSKTL